jgi:ubiquinone biosynthesis protein
VRVPRVLDEFTTRRVLVMEFIDGVFMSDFIRSTLADPASVAAWCEENNIDPEVVGWRLYQTHTRQVYEDNLFHSDLHPGNIVLLRDSRIGLIDFGSVGSIEASKLRKYYMIFAAVGRKDFNKVADLFLLLTSGLPPIDVDEVKGAIVRVMRAWEASTSVIGLPFHEKSLSHAMNEIAQVFRQYRIPIAWELMRVNRAELTLDLSLQYLMPDADYHALIARYEEKAKRRALRRTFAHDDLPDRVLELAAVADVAGYLRDNAALDAEWVRRRAMTFENELDGAAYAGWTLVSLVATAAWALSALLVLGITQQVVDWWPGEQAQDAADALAPWLTGQGAAVWIVTLLAALYLARTMRMLRRRIARGTRSS